MSDPVATPVVEQNIEDVKTIKERNKEEMVVDEGSDLSTYDKSHNVPFVADYFNIGDLYGVNKQVNNMVSSINKYIQEQADGKAIVFFAKQLLDSCSQEMNLKSEDAPYFKLKMVKQILGIRTRQMRYANVKKRVLEDINTMQ